jgi:GT2 family glycosyltransferase
MRLAIIIATLGRKKLLNRLLAHLEDQARLPDAVIVSAPDDSHVEPFETKRFEMRYVFGPAGSSAQRNAALEAAAGDFDLLTFMDDDFLPARDYLARVAANFSDHPDWAVIMGHAVRDGARDAGLSFEQGLDELRRAEAGEPAPEEITDQVGAYGCNMSVRSRFVGDLRFDERLVLYGWQEDIDFTSQLRRHGRVVRVSSMIGVHLGVKSGRVSGVRFGYSQVVNPIYLVRKGTVPRRFALGLVCRNVCANIVKSIRPEPYVDRRGRLKGNLVAVLHLIKGRVEPEYVLNL